MFSADGTKALIGEAVRDVLPADLLDWALSGMHPEHEGIKPFFVNGREIACRCRSMGEFSRSNGVLLIIETGLHAGSFEDGLPASKGE